MKGLKIALVGAAVAMLSGCSTFFAVGQEDFSCSGFEDGENCQSARDVYEATGDANYDVDGKGESDGAAATGEAGGKKQWNVEVDNYVAPSVPNKPVPIREPAKVMRVWMAPWEDNNGDLHVSSYIYTEIEERKWVYGNQTDTRSNRTKSLQKMSSQPRLGGSGNRGGSAPSPRAPNGDSGFKTDVPTQRDLQELSGQ